MAECHNTNITIAVHWHAYWIKTLEQFELYEIVVLRVFVCVFAGCFSWVIADEARVRPCRSLELGSVTSESDLRCRFEIDVWPWHCLHAALLTSGNTHSLQNTWMQSNAVFTANYFVFFVYVWWWIPDLFYIIIEVILYSFYSFS